MNFETFKVLTIITFALIICVYMWDTLGILKKDVSNVERIAKLEVRTEIMLAEIAKLNKENYERRTH